MRSDFSLKTRLFVSISVVLLVVMLAPFLYYRHKLLEDIQAEAEARAVGQIHFVHWLLEEQGGFQNNELLHDWLDRVGDRLGVRITYVAEGGRAIADSVIPFEEIAAMENLASRPEIVQSMTNEIGMVVRFSGAHQQNMIFAAERVSAQGAIPAGVIRIAMDVPGVKDRMDRMSNASLVIIIFAALAVAVVSRRLTARLNGLAGVLTGAVDAVAKENYKYRVRVSPTKELKPFVESVNRMLELVDSRILSITDQKQKLEAILNGMREGVMVLDARGRVQTMNRAMGAIVPSFSQGVGRRPLEIILSPELQSACDKVLAGGAEYVNRPLNLQITLERERIYDVNIVKLQDVQRLEGAILVLYDISELKRLEKVRQDFVANVSHELRTPLTSIKGYAETLLSEEKDSTNGRKSFLEIILKNANHMVRIVDDLLQLARLESHNKPISIATVNASLVLRTAWDACAPFAESKRVRLVSHLPSAGAWVEADADQILQVFINLMDNAVKYSPEGGEVTVGGQVRDGRMEFSVTDDGPGIPKADQLRIFERFYRVEKHRTIQSGSSGLGLAICRHIIKNHHGRIWVESPPVGKNNGASFHFTLTSGSAPGGNGLSET
jgi:two-component system phosphate regulon sensor histidine kinase PhoR